MATLQLLCFFGFFFMVHSIPTVTKCKKSDTDCITKSAQELVPVFAEGVAGLKPLDPLKIDEIDGSAPNLQIVGKNVIVTGLKKCSLQSVSRDSENSKLNVDLICSVDVDGEFDVKGKVLILTLDGTAHLDITLNKIHLNVDIDYDEIEKSGKKHWHIKHWDFTYTLEDKSSIVLTNVFNGNEQLTQAIRDLLSSSSDEIVLNLGPPIAKSMAAEVVHTINDFFSLAPIEDLTLN